MRQSRYYRPVLFIAATACVLVYFFSFAGQGLWADFSHDDLMNIAKAWQRSVGQLVGEIALFFRPSQTYRPTGSLFYWLLFYWFGFDDGFPLRVACYVLLLANLWLAYALARRLSHSREVGGLVVLLLAYHGEAYGIYTNSGFCYDLLCFFFYAAAFVYYLRAREEGALLRVRQLAVWTGLYVLCLSSKEMAVSLPVMIGVYELMAHPPASWRLGSVGRWLMNEGRGPVLGGVLTAMFLVGRLNGAAALSTVDAYQPEFRLDVYLDRAWHFLWFALYRPDWLGPKLAGCAVAATALLAFRSRSVPMRFGLVWMWIVILPVAVIRQRSLDGAYVAGFGLALLVAAALVALRGRVSAPVLFFAVLAAMVGFHGKYGDLHYPNRTEENRHIRAVYEQLRALQHEFPDGSRVLFLNDPFPQQEWNSYFLVALHSPESKVQVYRPERLQRDWKPSYIVNPGFVFTYEDDRLIACDPEPFQKVAVRDLPEVRCAAAAGAYR